MTKNTLCFLPTILYQIFFKSEEGWYVACVKFFKLYQYPNISFLYMVQTKKYIHIQTESLKLLTSINSASSTSVFKTVNACKLTRSIKILCR